MLDPERLPRLEEGRARLSDPPAKLAPYEVDWERFDPSHIDQLQEVLTQATAEAPLQTFLADHPYVLILGVLGQKRQAWVFDRPRFGAEYIPDFLIGMRDSLGPTWMLVELESPTVNPLKQRGAIREHLHHAVQQIQDWRRWLRANNVYFEKQSGCWGIEAGCAGCVVIGRREMRDDEDGQARIRDFKRDADVEVMSYDRLVETYRNHSDWLVPQSQRIEALRAASPR